MKPPRPARPYRPNEIEGSWDQSRSPLTGQGLLYSRPRRHLQTWGVSLQAPPGHRAAEGVGDPSCVASCFLRSCGARRRRGRGRGLLSPASSGAVATGAVSYFATALREGKGQPPCTPQTGSSRILGGIASGFCRPHRQSGSAQPLQPGPPPTHPKTPATADLPGSRQSRAAYSLTRPGPAPSCQEET